MKNPILFLSPHAARARVLGTKTRNREGGFSLIETMAAMAIVAILALAIVPQFGKYMERAAVQNVIADVSSAQLLINSDYGLTGASAYTQLNVAASTAASAKNPETTLVATVTTATNSYKIVGTSTAVTHYSILFDSALSVMKVTRTS